MIIKEATDGPAQRFVVRHVYNYGFRVYNFRRLIPVNVGSCWKVKAWLVLPRWFLVWCGIATNKMYLKYRIKCFVCMQIWMVLPALTKAIFLRKWPIGREFVDSAALWRHQMEAFSALLAICARNSPVTGECHRWIPRTKPVTRSFDFFYFIFIKTYLTRITHQPRAVLHEVLPYTTQLINIVTIVQHETW